MALPLGPLATTARSASCVSLALFEALSVVATSGLQCGRVLGLLFPSGHTLRQSLLRLAQSGLGGGNPLLPLPLAGCHLRSDLLLVGFQFLLRTGDRLLLLLFLPGRPCAPTAFRNLPGVLSVACALPAFVATTPGLTSISAVVAGRLRTRRKISSDQFGVVLLGRRRVSQARSGGRRRRLQRSVR